MSRSLSRLVCPGLLAVAWLLNPTDAQAWHPGQPVPVSTNSVCVFRLDVKCGPEAFARPAGPWYSYFPVDPHLLAAPQAQAFPNWPAQFPPALPAAPPAPSRPMPGVTYYPAPSMPYPYGQYSYGGVYPVSYYGPQASGYWYAQ